MNIQLKDLKIDPRLEIIPAHPDHLAIFWPKIEPWLANALTYGPPLFLPEDIKEKLKSKDFICWLAIIENEIIGFSIVSIVQYPRARVCDIHWTGGVKHLGRAWLKGMLQVIESWAKSSGCTHSAGGGRRGWIEVFGFKEHGVMFIKDL